MKIVFSKTWRFIKWGSLYLFLFLVLFTIYCIFSVPDLCTLKTKNPETSAFIEMRKEQWKDKNLKRKIDRRWVPLSAISRNLRNAVIAAEDPNFYHHHGLDFYSIKIAFQENWEEKKVVVGASTITQQLMKNLFLSPSQNPLRKWKEAILALRVERCVKKDRILEIYLNTIEWGESTYGIEAASRRYFGKSAAYLDAAESALLAAMIPNPIQRNPYVRNPTLWRKKNTILGYMRKRGVLSKEDYQAAVNEKIRLR
jgi:monofunctional biosynthetic peptidoglycan transglycosylase